jgi:hypothetical protein
MNVTKERSWVTLTILLIKKIEKKILKDCTNVDNFCKKYALAQHCISPEERSVLMADRRGRNRGRYIAPQLGHELPAIEKSTNRKQVRVFQPIGGGIEAWVCH